MRKIYKLGALTVCVLATVFFTTAAFATITLTPTRVVFGDRDRFKEVTLVNSGNETKTYEIEWQFYKMIQDQEPPYEQEQGSITDFDLTQYIVYTPRRVTLPPGAKQKVRLALRRPAEVPPGEYRAHLNFRTVREAPSTTNKDLGQGRQSAAVQINVGYSIPVVFDAGTPDVQATIEGLEFKRNPTNGMLDAFVKVSRSGGPYGVMGHLFIYNDKNEVIGEMGNANIFPEVNSRTFRVPVPNEEKMGSAVTVSVKRDDKAGNEIYTQRTFPVQR